MKSKKEIIKKIEKLKAYINSVSLKAMLLESERISYAGTSGAIEILEWVLESEE